MTPYDSVTTFGAGGLARERPALARFRQGGCSASIQRSERDRLGNPLVGGGRANLPAGCITFAQP